MSTTTQDIMRKYDFEILTLCPPTTIEESWLKDSKLHSVKRTSDGEVFTLGDRVSNDLMKGKIIEFHIVEGNMYVETTWSKVGMGLDDIHKLPLLPSKYQEGDPVSLNYYGTVFVTGWIHKVHFSKNKVTYDVEILTQHRGKTHNFRMYNVDSDFVQDRADINL